MRSYATTPSIYKVHAEDLRRTVLQMDPGSNFKPCVRHLECFERDKKRYTGQKTISGTKNDIRDKKRYQGDISFLCPPIINLIKAQVCDKRLYLPIHGASHLIGVAKMVDLQH